MTFKPLEHAVSPGLSSYERESYARYHDPNLANTFAAIAAGHLTIQAQRTYTQMHCTLRAKISTALKLYGKELDCRELWIRFLLGPASAKNSRTFMSNKT